MCSDTTQLASWPHFEADEIAAATAVLESGRINYWTGNEGREFEREFADFCGVSHGVAVSNGTAALELALRALGIGAGDEVIVTPRSFMASASSVVMVGATPVFADIDPDSQNITAETVRAVLTDKTRVILVVHLAGWPCDMAPIMRLAKQHGLKVLEDCAQAHGATYEGRVVGSIGDIGAFSFCTDKIMSLGGEGGMVVTDDRELWKKVWSLKDHGRDYEKIYQQEHPPGFRWFCTSFGTNARLTEMQSAIGRSQLRKLPAWLAARQRNASRLSRALSKWPALRVPSPPGNVGHAYYKLYAYVVPELLKAGWNRDKIMIELNAVGVEVSVGVCPEIYMEDAFNELTGRPTVRLPNAQRLGETSLMFPVDHMRDEAKIESIAVTVNQVMASATK